MRESIRRTIFPGTFMRVDPDPRRTAQLAVIHQAKKELSLDDVTYRAIVKRVSAKFRREPVESSAQMTSRERAALLEELHHFGFRKPLNRPERSPGGPQEEKIRALWQALIDSGALHDSSEKALRSFIRRQTGTVEIPRWLTAEQANKVIEGLKAWHRRASSKDAGIPRASDSPDALE
jgi:phage gp16-like protein